MRSGFFNSEIIGYDAENMPVFDRAEEASFFAKYFSQFISNGVFPNPSTNMQVLATEGMTIKVDTGVCYINGYMGWVEPFEMLEIEESDTRARIDRIVARLDFTDRSIKLAIKKGVVSGTPIAPELQRDYDIYEIGLADIKVNANVVEIKQENITDLRLNTELCGMVANHLQHLDTTTLFNQYQDWLNRVTSEAEEGLEEWKQKFETTLDEEKQKFETILNNLKNFYTEDFDKWFKNLKVVLSENVAGNLQLEIEDLQDNVSNINENIYNLEIQVGNANETLNNYIQNTNTIKTETHTPTYSESSINKPEINLQFIRQGNLVTLFLKLHLKDVIYSINPTVAIRGETKEKLKDFFPYIDIREPIFAMDWTGTAEQDIQSVQPCGVGDVIIKAEGAIFFKCYITKPCTFYKTFTYMAKE